MAEFQELIKNFERIRDYMRQFYVYGFKVRNDFTEKSPRTYDNERRRIESYLDHYIHTEYSSKGKQVSISIDSKSISQNPLYAAWKAKSFTDNDLMLHFFIPDLLCDGQEMSVNEITDRISTDYGVVFEEQTVRLKLKEYEAEGLFSSRKLGKKQLYRLKKSESLDKILTSAVKLFQETAPFGFIGSTILDREQADNNLFRFKHHFIVHTLEDGVLFEILKAFREKRKIRFENKASRSGTVSTFTGIPLKIFVSTLTGRRYLCIYKEDSRRFFNMRLDSITKVQHLEEYPFYDERQKELKQNLSKCFGVSFSGTVRSARIEEIYIKLRIDEKREAYVLERLYREARGGEIIKTAENTFLYSGLFFDTNELLPWIKTFTGRILDIQGTSPYVVNKLLCDLNKMYEMYCKEE